MMPEVSGEQKAADEAAFERARREALADVEQRQQQARQFQESRTPTTDVTAGDEVLL